MFSIAPTTKLSSFEGQKITFEDLQRAKGAARVHLVMYGYPLSEMNDGLLTTQAVNHIVNYRKAKKAKYEETMNTRMGWSPTNEGVRIMVEGDDSISELKKKLEKQRLYVEMLANAQEIVRYYPRNAQSLVNVATYGKEIGKIIG
jgi:predicted SpoU family rRNA methylase